MNVRQSFIAISVIILAAIGVVAYFWWQPILWSLILIVPIILLGISDIFSKKHTLKSNFPVVGNFRYILEKLRPGIMQYFV